MWACSIKMRGYGLLLLLAGAVAGKSEALPLASFTCPCLARSVEREEQQGITSTITTWTVVKSCTCAPPDDLSLGADWESDQTQTERTLLEQVQGAEHQAERQSAQQAIVTVSNHDTLVIDVNGFDIEFRGVAFAVGGTGDKAGDRARFIVRDSTKDGGSSAMGRSRGSLTLREAPVFALHLASADGEVRVRTFIADNAGGIHLSRHLGDPSYLALTDDVIFSGNTAEAMLAYDASVTMTGGVMAFHDNALMPVFATSSPDQMCGLSFSPSSCVELGHLMSLSDTTYDSDGFLHAWVGHYDSCPTYTYGPPPPSVNGH